MAFVNFAPELAAAYTITGPDGTVAVLNNQASPNAAGVVTDLTGLDSADVIDAGGTLVEGDGGYAGVNWYGRRPITMTIQTYGYPDAATRAAQITRLRRSTNAMRSDGTLSWTNTAAGSVPMHVPFRRQAPLRVTGGWTKTINLALVSQIAPLLGNTVNLSPAGTASITVENQGDYQFGNLIYVYVAGPTAGQIIVSNTTTGGYVAFNTGLTVPSGQTLTIDMANHLAARSDIGFVNSFLDYGSSTWFGLQTGNNVLTTNTGTIGVSYSSAWV